MSRFFADGFRDRRWSGVLVLALAMAARPALSSGDTLDLPAADVRGVREVAPAEGVHRLEGETLRRFATLEDALASLPGFRVRRAGGLGGYSELSFRGARASAVAVYVDGVRLNQDGDGAPDLSKWPALWFSSLEARVGFDGAGAGPGALARIDLSTRSTRRAEAHARGGSFGTFEGATQATFPSGDRAGAWRWTIGAQGQTARNDYPVFSDNGTVYNTADDATWRMDNNAYGSRGARAALRREDGASSHAFSLLWLDSRKEYPGLFPSSSRAYTERTDWLAAWRLTHASPTARAGDANGSGVTWDADAQARRLEDSYRDPDQTLGPFSFEQARVSTAGEIGVGAGLPLTAGDFVRRFGAWDGRADIRLRAEKIDPTAKPFTQQMESPAAERYEAGAGLRVTARTLPFLPPALTFAAEARPAWIRFRADGVRSFPSGPLSAPADEIFAQAALRAAAEWPTRAGTWGVVARREPRVPSSGEFLGDNNGIQHNPTLRAEEARSISLMHALTFGRGGRGSFGSAAEGTAPSYTLESSVYLNLYDDPIRLAQRGASPFLRYENGADYRAVGAEWSARAETRRVDASASLSLQDATIRAGFYEGKRPAYLSEADLHAELFWKPIAGGRLGALLDARGPYYPGEANIPVSRRDAEWELGAHAGYTKGSGRLALDIRNLFDRRHRDFARSPRSGRAWTLSYSYGF